MTTTITRDDDGHSHFFLDVCASHDLLVCNLVRYFCAKANQSIKDLCPLMGWNKLGNVMMHRTDELLLYISGSLV